MKKKQTLRDRLDGVLMEYIREFEEKHEVYIEFAAGDDLMGILSFGDWFFNISDIIYDIDNDLPKGLIFRWHDDYLDEDKNPNSERINLHSYAKGLRFEDLQSNKDKKAFMNNLNRRNFSKKLKLHKATETSKDFVFCEYIHFWHGCAYATNKTLIVKVELDKSFGWSDFEEDEIKLLHGKSIHRELYEQLLEYETVNVTDNGFVCQHNNTTTLFPLIDLDEAKLVDKLVKEFDKEAGLIGVVHMGDNIKRIGFNITHLTTLVKSTGVVEWEFRSKRSSNFAGKIISVIPFSDVAEGVEAVVLPICTDY